jgi:Holliday junction resolvase RusA-like endonuclease
MTAALGFGEIVRQLMALRVPRDKAEQRARELTGAGKGSPLLSAGELPILLPFELTIPWSVLVPDNDKYGVINGRMMLQAKYRMAKQKIAGLARAVTGELSPITAPLALVARVYVPDNRPHDVANFAKLVHDALEGVVYKNDRWLWDVRWIRAGVDVDHPRAEITISPART